MNAATPMPITPLRRCIVTGARKPTDQLIRLVVGPDGCLAADLDQRLPGRGVWVSADRAVIEKAVRGSLGALAARSLKRKPPLSVAPDLPERIEERLKTRVLNRLGLEKRAGRLVTGFDQVAELARRGQLAVLITARDAAADSRRKAQQLLGGAEVEILRLFSRDELSLALGRENVVHAALKRGGAEAKILQAAKALSHYCGEEGTQDA